MLLSANMIRIHDTFGINETFDVFAKAGFEGIDFNNDVKEYYSDKHDEHFYRDLAKYAASKGIAICQAHAPFPSSYDDEEKTEKRFKEIVQSMKNAALAFSAVQICRMFWVYNRVWRNTEKRIQIQVSRGVV